MESIRFLSVFTICGVSCPLAHAIPLQTLWSCAIYTGRLATKTANPRRTKTNHAARASKSQRPCKRVSAESCSFELFVLSIVCWTSTDAFPAWHASYTSTWLCWVSSYIRSTLLIYIIADNTFALHYFIMYSVLKALRKTKRGTSSDELLLTRWIRGTIECFSLFSMIERWWRLTQTYSAILGLMIQFNKLIQPSVGADLSCTPPIHRPWWLFCYPAS